VLPKQNTRACTRFGTFDATGMHSPSNRRRQYRTGSMIPTPLAARRFRRTR
jgi:hypothetical protein